MGTPAATKPATLLAWDFDWSLVEENSDTFVISRLGADSIYKAGRQRGMPWTQLMDHTLQARALHAPCHQMHGAARSALRHWKLACRLGVA